MTKDWKPIARTATEAAKELGHQIGGFEINQKTPSVRMASCDKCFGCCWIGYAGIVKGFQAGGRALKYRCGTNKAKGIL